MWRSPASGTRSCRQSRSTPHEMGLLHAATAAKLAGDWGMGRVLEQMFSKERHMAKNEAKEVLQALADKYCRRIQRGELEAGHLADLQETASEYGLALMLDNQGPLKIKVQKAKEGSRREDG